MGSSWSGSKWGADDDASAVAAANEAALAAARRHRMQQMLNQPRPRMRSVPTSNSSDRPREFETRSERRQ